MAKAAEIAGPRLDLKVLVIDDEPSVAEAVAETLERIGCHCRIATSGHEGLERIREGNLDLVLTDLVMGDNGGIEIVEETKRFWPDVEVLVFTGHSSVSTAVEAMQKGALAYLEKPLDVDVLRTQVQKAAEKQRLVRESSDLKRQIDKRYGFESIIGRSPAMQRVFDVLGQISATNATVLIQGESGTGKELIARALHNHSPRRARPFVALNCAALSEGILESELFGHEKGAFTGADQMRHGRFEYAQHGTLFLDEVGDMPMTTQIKLLRVIEQREIMRVGSNVPIKVDVRLVAATNQNLEALVREKRFREDLYFRLNVVRINLPPLRDRREDIPLLIETFLRDFARQHQKSLASIRPAGDGDPLRLPLAGQRARVDELHRGDGGDGQRRRARRGRHPAAHLLRAGARAQRHGHPAGHVHGRGGEDLHPAHPRADRTATAKKPPESSRSASGRCTGSSRNTD